jgi:hypothetical protein
MVDSVLNYWSSEGDFCADFGSRECMYYSNDVNISAPLSCHCTDMIHACTQLSAAGDEVSHSQEGRNELVQTRRKNTGNIIFTAGYKAEPSCTMGVGETAAKLEHEQVQKFSVETLPFVITREKSYGFASSSNCRFRITVHLLVRSS